MHKVQPSTSNKTRLGNDIRLAVVMVGHYDSRLTLEIAKASKKGSITVTTIAAVSLLFLLVTFASAIFSTSFFKCDDNSGSWQVSDMTWACWAVAIPLTVDKVLTWEQVAMGKNDEPEKEPQQPA